MGFPYFVVKQPPLQVKPCLTDSGTNIHVQNNVHKQLLFWFCFSPTLCLVSLGDFLLHSLTGFYPKVNKRQQIKHTINLNKVMCFSQFEQLKKTLKTSGIMLEHSSTTFITHRGLQTF